MASTNASASGTTVSAATTRPGAPPERDARQAHEGRLAAQARPVRQVHERVVARALRVADARDCDAARLARGLHHEHGLGAPQALPRAVERREEPVGAHRLEQVGDRVHVIAVEDVVDDAGHEDDLRALAALAQEPSELHSARAGHLYVEQRNVRGAVVEREEQRVGGGERVHARLDAAPARPVAREARDEVRGGPLVVAHGYLQHALLASSLRPSHDGARSAGGATGGSRNPRVRERTDLRKPPARRGQRDVMKRQLFESAGQTGDTARRASHRLTP